MSDEDAMAYIGIAPCCGACVAATIDTLRFKKDTAKFVSDLLRDGLTVERRPVAWVRENLRLCECKPKPKSAPSLPGLDAA